MAENTELYETYGQAPWNHEAELPYYPEQSDVEIRELQYQAESAAEEGEMSDTTKQTQATADESGEEAYADWEQLMKICQLLSQARVEVMKLSRPTWPKIAEPLGTVHRLAVDLGEECLTRWMQAN